MRPRQAEIGYGGAHYRVVADRGRASAQSCVDCGEPAREWSYRGGSDDERVEDGCSYSLNVDDYDPRCARCHKRYDDVVSKLPQNRADYPWSDEEHKEKIRQGALRRWARQKGEISE